MKHLIFHSEGILPSLLVALSIGLFVVLFLVLILLLRCNVHLRHMAAMHEQHSQQRLRLLRSLLDLCYAYKESPQVFLDKFKDRVNFCQLKTYELFDLDDRSLSSLKEDERLLCRLLEEGFTQRELCVIFNLKKTSYVYVKYHRILHKLQLQNLHV